MTMKRGDTPNLEQWAKLKSEGWTVESWNAEMDSRSAQNRSDRMWMIAFPFIAAAMIYWAATH